MQAFVLMLFLLLRPLLYSWTSNDESIAQQLLRYSGASAEFEMTVFDVSVTVSVRGTDFLGQVSDWVSTEVTRLSGAAPIVSFSTESTNKFWDEEIFITALAEFSRCPLPKTALIFAWSHVVDPEGDHAVFPEVLLARTSQSQLLVPANSLVPGSKYTLHVRVSMSGDMSKSSTGLHTVNILERGLFAVISGGSEMRFAVLQDFVLNASQSRDLDVTSDAAQGLDFSWACRAMLARSNAKVSLGKASEQLIESDCRDSNGMTLAFAQTATLTIAAGILSPTTLTPYIFSLSVSKQSKVVSTQSISVEIVPQAVPTVSIRIPEGPTSPDGALLMSPEHKFTLSGSCEDPLGMIEWVFEPSLNLRSQDIANVLPLGTASPSVIVSGGFGAFAAGNTYVVQMKCMSADASVGKSQVTVRINTAPEGLGCKACVLRGDGKACVKEGNAITDTFRCASCVVCRAVLCQGMSRHHRNVKRFFVCGVTCCCV